MKKITVLILLTLCTTQIEAAHQAPTSPEKRFCADTAAIDQDPTLVDLQFWLENLEEKDEEGCTILDNFRNRDLRHYLLLKNLEKKIKQRIKLEKLRREVREELRAEKEALAQQAALRAQEQQQYADSVVELCQSLEEFE